MGNVTSTDKAKVREILDEMNLEWIGDAKTECVMDSTGLETMKRTNKHNTECILYRNDDETVKLILPPEGPWYVEDPSLQISKSKIVRISDHPGGKTRPSYFVYLHLENRDRIRIDHAKSKLYNTKYGQWRIFYRSSLLFPHKTTTEETLELYGRESS